MVEGPGCKLKGEKIKAKVLKQVAKAVKGNAVERAEKQLKKENKGNSADNAGIHHLKTPFHQVVGQPLDNVLTLGKELFMFFGSSCLRVHFLMAGSFHINNIQVDKDGGKKISATPSLEIQFSKDTLTFYRCAAEIRPSSACLQKYTNLQELDICSATFNPKKAVSEIMIEQERQLCDVLLDQDVLPGVGNIIKNEALFDSGLKPDSKVKELSEEQISHLVKMTRDFSMVFYKCRKNGTNLRQCMKVYQKGRCGECETKIVMTRMGDDSERVTYFCPTCQTNDMRQPGKLKLPCKNSLLGWVQTDREVADKEEWACSQCTLLNPGSQGNCSACLNPKNYSSPGLASGCTSTCSATTNTVCSSRQKRKAQSDMPCTAEDRSKCIKTEAGPQLTFSRTVQKSFEEASPSSLEGFASSKIPLCHGHQAQCALRQSFKDNHNRGRWFFVCASTVRTKQCGFFQWADDKFPVCAGHGKVCALRTVVKQGPNNGRRFFCCPLRKNSCQFFEWAWGYS